MFTFNNATRLLAISFPLLSFFVLGDFPILQQRHNGHIRQIQQHKHRQQHEQPQASSSLLQRALWAKRQQT